MIKNPRNFEEVLWDSANELGKLMLPQLILDEITIPKPHELTAKAV